MRRNCGCRQTQLLELSYGPGFDCGCCVQDHPPGISCCPVFPGPLFVEIGKVLEWGGWYMGHDLRWRFVSGEDGTWDMMWHEIGAVGVGIPE
jgi:hypothetical protein